MGNIDEKDFLQTNEQYGDGIAINIYKNEYSLVAAKKNGEDIWMEWCYPKRGKGPSEKQIPMKISLGVKAEAIQKLEKILAMIEGRTSPDYEYPGDKDDDIAF